MYTCIMYTNSKAGTIACRVRFLVGARGHRWPERRANLIRLGNSFIRRSVSRSSSGFRELVRATVRSREDGSGARLVHAIILYY